jgi:hypothetical protein
MLMLFYCRKHIRNWLMNRYGGKSGGDSIASKKLAIEIVLFAMRSRY